MKLCSWQKFVLFCLSEHIISDQVDCRHIDLQDNKQHYLKTLFRVVHEQHLFFRAFVLEWSLVRPWRGRNKPMLNRRQPREIDVDSLPMFQDSLSPVAFFNHFGSYTTFGGKGFESWPGLSESFVNFCLSHPFEPAS